MITNNKIFVYGTLMDGLLQKVLPDVDGCIKKKRYGKIIGRLFDMGEYPAAKPTTLKTKLIEGQVYELEPASIQQVLSRMDEYEEYDPNNKATSLYIRKITPVITKDGSISKAWVYWYNKPLKGENEILNGNYKKYLSSQD
jgi:gamma-glutamylcyclotransferase (GGCT)/AIG2-like uncharacterized protein YtfP